MIRGNSTEKTVETLRGRFSWVFQLSNSHVFRSHSYSHGIQFNSAFFFLNGSYENDMLSDMTWGSRYKISRNPTLHMSMRVRSIPLAYCRWCYNYRQTTKHQKTTITNHRRVSTLGKNDLHKRMSLFKAEVNLQRKQIWDNICYASILPSFFIHK